MSRPTARCSRRAPCSMAASQGKTKVYSVDHLHGMEPLFSDIYAAAKAQGIPAETVISEYAPGQYELTLNYRKDVMRAADDLVMLKRLVRAQARRHGVAACFMAKPIGRCRLGHAFPCLAAGQGRPKRLCGSRWRELVAAVAAGAWWPDPDDGGIDAGVCAARQFLAALRIAILLRRWRRPRGVDGRAGAGRGSQRRRRPAPSSTGRRRRRQSMSSPPTVLAAIIKGLDEGLDPGPENHGKGYEAAISAASDACQLARRDEPPRRRTVPERRARRGSCIGPSWRSNSARCLRVARAGQRTGLPPLFARGVSQMATGSTDQDRPRWLTFVPVAEPGTKRSPTHAVQAMLPASIRPWHPHPPRAKRVEPSAKARHSTFSEPSDPWACRRPVRGCRRRH